MDRRRLMFGCLGVGLCVLAAGGRCRAGSAPSSVLAPVPLELLAPDVRERVRSVLEHPTLTTRGRAEIFSCRPNTYYWLLEHPDQASRLWKLIGARCADVQDGGGGRFGWSDGQGSAIHWHAVLRTPSQRVWYAEGQVKPGMMLPASAVRAVVVLYVTEGHDEQGRPALKHQVELSLKADGAAVAMAARVLGASAPKLAEDYVGQIETFFGGLAWYLDDNPPRARELFEKLRQGEQPQPK
jgi:hypothetical protein